MNLVKKEKLINGIVLIFSVVTSLIFAEGILRIVDYDYNPLRIRILGGEDYKLSDDYKSDWRYYHAFKDEAFIYDNSLFWRPKFGYKDLFNSQGYRGNVLGVKTNDEYRIFALGDSNTLGIEAKRRDSNWPEVLEQEFHQNGNQHVRVINSGVWGYSSYQGRIRFDEVLSLDPNMILVSFGVNDGHRVFTPDKEWSSRSNRIRVFLSSHFKIALLVQAVEEKLISLYRSTFYKSEVLKSRVSLDDYRNNLEYMIKESRRRGVRIVLLTRPFLTVTNTPNSGDSYTYLYNNIVRDISTEFGIDMIDLERLFIGKDWFFSDNSHFNFFMVFHR